MKTCICKDKQRGCSLEVRKSNFILYRNVIILLSVAACMFLIIKIVEME